MAVAYFIGIDGGGTRATAVATDEHGTELARREGPAALVRTADPAAGAAALAHLVEETLAAAGGRPPAAAVCCALAGAGRPEERRAVTKALRERNVARALEVTSDAEAALEAGLAGEPGILLIAGTGSIARGVGPDGRRARAGGWGALLGDEGSGYALGLAALRAAVRAHDGRDRPTVLLDRALEHAGVSAPDALIAWSAQAPKGDIAALAPAVVAAADAGDETAAALVDEAARELARLVAALHRRLGPWPGPVPLALAGGLILPGRPLRPRVEAALRSLELPLEVREGPVDAALGAAALARRAARRMTSFPT